MKIIIAVSCNKSNKRIRTQTTYKSHLCQIVGYFTDYFHPVSDCWLLYCWISSCVKYCWLLYWWIPSCGRSLVTLLMNSLLCQIVGNLTDEFPTVSDRWLLNWLLRSRVRLLITLLMNFLLCQILLITLLMKDRWLLYWWINSLLCQIVGYLTDEFPTVSDRLLLLNWWIPYCVRSLVT